MTARWQVILLVNIIIGRSSYIASDLHAVEELLQSLESLPETASANHEVAPTPVRNASASGAP